MIDIHSHILPGIDDGPKTMEHSLQLASLYEKAGFRTVVATPHWMPGTIWTPSPADLKTRITELQHALEEEQITLSIHPGMEIAFDNETLDRLRKNNLQTLAGQSYLLLETPFQQLPLGWETIFFNIISDGYKIILAHPERCRQVHQHPEILKKMIEAGIYIQLNYDSFLGFNGKATKKTAFYLAEQGCVHCLASDSHDATHRHPGSVKDALNNIAARVGEKTAEIISTTNPKRILAGLPLKQPAKAETKKRKKWLFF